MPQGSNPLAAYIIAENIRECVTERLAQVYEMDPENGAMVRNCVIAGDIAWDDCECGQLVVAYQRSFPSATFPVIAAATVDTGRCGPPYLVFQYGISILRCSPDTDTEAPPPCEALDAVAQLVIRDAFAARAGTLCCLSDLSKRHGTNPPEIIDYFIQDQVAVGADGGCQGTLLTTLVAVNSGCPCENT